MRRSRTPGHRRRGTGRAVASGIVLAVLAVAGCAEPPLPDADSPVGAPSETTFEQEPAAVPPELVEQAQLLEETLHRIDGHLEAAASAAALDRARAAGRLAVAELVADAELDGPDGTGPDTDGPDGDGPDGDGPATEDGATGGDGPTGADGPALLPSSTPERSQTLEEPDALTSALAVAQDAGGTAGRELAGLLGEQVAGDLGAWQRDAAGMVELARAATQAGASPEDVEGSVLALSGEGTRALAWALMVADAPDLPTAQAAAERASAHVGLILTALDELWATSPVPAP